MRGLDSGSRGRTLGIMVTAVAVALIIWNVPSLDFLLYPLRLFVTLIHECGHGLAALLTGGRIERLVVFANGSGVATTGGGLRWIILPAGYLGAAAFGAALFYLANRLPHTRTVAVALGIGIGAIAILFTDFLSTAFIVGILFAAILIFIGRRGNRDLNLFVLNWLSVITALNAVFDIVSLVQYPDTSIASVRNDAAAFSAEVAPLIPGSVWAFLWAAIALAMLGGAIYFGVVKRRAYNSE